MLILSGCLNSVKNSGSSGLNNLMPFSILSDKYSSYIGFTEDEVEKILIDAGIPEQMEVVRDWYEGYIFGNTHIYCPWDVMRYVNDTIDGRYNHGKLPENYWINTSTNNLEIIHGFLGKSADAQEKFSELLAWKTIEQSINENIPYDMIYESGDNLWSALAEMGYITKASVDNDHKLKIPNKEVLEVFLKEVAGIGSE